MKFVDLNKLAKKRVSTPVPNKILTDEVVSNWEISSEQLVKSYISLIDLDAKNAWLKECFYELFSILNFDEMSPSLSVESLAKFVDDMAVHNFKDRKLVGQTFVAFSSLVDKSKEDRLISLAENTNAIQEEIFKHSWISSKIMIKEQVMLQRHLLKKSKYELKKYNLLFECPVGYSKFITLLYLMYYDSAREIKANFYVSELNQLMGEYSLDSMRCLDIILHVSSEFTLKHYKYFLKFLKLTEFWPKNDVTDNSNYESLNKKGNIIASNIIAFTIGKSKNSKDLIKYLDMCCLLIKAGFVNFASVWNNFGPSENLYNECLDDMEKELELDSSKGSENALAMATALADDSDDEISNKDAKESTSDANDKEQDGEKTAEEEKLTKEDFIEQIKKKSLFLQRLLAHGCLVPVLYVLHKNSKLLIVNDMLPNLLETVFDYQVSQLYNSKFANNILTKKTMKPIYTHTNLLVRNRPRVIKSEVSHDPYSSMNLQIRYEFYMKDWNQNIPKISSIDQLFEMTHEYCSILGPFLSKNTQLLSKLCRIGVSCINSKVKDEDLEVIDKWIDYCRKFLLPSIAMLENDPVTANEIYSLMVLFPFEKRYFMYNEMLTKISVEDTLVKIGFNKIEKNSKSILKSLSTDSKEVNARKLSSLISTNPLATLIPVVKQIENYDKVAELVIFTAQFFNDFAHDVLQYVILTRVTAKRDMMQTDGVNLASWVVRLSLFIAGLAQTCHKMSLGNITTFVVKTLHQGNVVAISILKELIGTVGGIKDLNEVNEKQIVMLNSAKPLQIAGRKLIHDFRDVNEKKTANLIQVFVEQNTISEVILLLYKLAFTNEYDFSHCKIVATRSDELSSILWKYIEMLKFSSTQENYNQYVLSFEKLINEYNFSLSWACHIWRVNTSQSQEYFQNGAKNPLFGSIKSTFQLWNQNLSNITLDLYANFWILSLYDLKFEAFLYREQEEILKKTLSNVIGLKKEQRLKQELDELEDSEAKHSKQVEYCKEYLKKTTDLWSEDKTVQDMQYFLKYCIIPRSLFSSSDAIYTANFVSSLFSSNTIMELFDTIVTSKLLRTFLFTCTTYEASNFGIFMLAFLDHVETIRPSEEKSNKLFDLYHELTADIISTLNESNYMSIRNGIEFMRHVSNVFPIIDIHVDLLVKTLEHNLLKEKREDIILPTNALLGHLKARLAKSLKKEDICELDAEELQIKKQLDSELEEISKYKSMKENDKKRERLRKQFEQNKKANEEKNAKKDLIIPKGPSGIKLPTRPKSPTTDTLSKNIKNVMVHLTSDNIDKALLAINNQQEAKKIKNKIINAASHEEFISQLTNELEKYFTSISKDENLDFDQNMEKLKEAASKLTKTSFQSIRSDSNQSKTSRYNADSNEKKTLESPMAKPSSRFGNQYPSREGSTDTRNNQVQSKFPSRNYDKEEMSRAAIKKRGRTEYGSQKNAHDFNRQYDNSNSSKYDYANSESSAAKRYRPNSPFQNSKKPIGDSNRFKFFDPVKNVKSSSELESKQSKPNQSRYKK